MADDVSNIDPEVQADGFERSIEKGLKSSPDGPQVVTISIMDPLKGISNAALLAHAEEFARECGLTEHVALMQRGALVAQSPYAFREMDSITEVERRALGQELIQKWRQPRALYMTVIVCFLGAAIQSWSQIGLIGASPSWPIALGVPDTGPDATDHNIWVVEIVTAGPQIVAALFGCWLSGSFNSIFGRRGAIFNSAIFLASSVVGSALCRTWQELLVTRLFLGIGTGIAASTIPIYAAESFPSKIRGGLATSWQMGTAFGAVLGFCSNLVFEHTGSKAWRWQLGVALIPSVMLLVGVYFCPESPRWYIKVGRFNRAFKSLCRLRNTNLQAARDLYYMHAQILEEEVYVNRGCCSHIAELSTISHVRRAAVAAWTVMAAQQISGLGVLTLYSTTIFTSAGADSKEALLLSLGFALVFFFFSWIAVFTIDKYGRRKLLMSSTSQAIWILLAAGLCFLIRPDDARLVSIAVFLYLFAAVSSPGTGAVPFVYSAEAFPRSHREVGMSFAAATNFFIAGILTITFVPLSRALGPTGTLGFFAGLNLLAFLIIALLVPETEWRTLEEIEVVFGIPTTATAGHWVFAIVPWYFRRFVLLRRHEPLESLPDWMTRVNEWMTAHFCRCGHRVREDSIHDAEDDKA